MQALRSLVSVSNERPLGVFESIVNYVLLETV